MTTPAFPIVFADLPTGRNPMSTFDDAFADVLSGAYQQAMPASSITGVLATANGGEANVATRTAMAALDTTKSTVSYLMEAGRQGWFQWDSSDLSAKVTADPGQGIYVPPASASTGASGAWVRVEGPKGPIRVTWFGAKGDGSNDDTTPIQRAINLAKALNSVATPYFGYPEVFFPAGCYKVTSTITLTSTYGLKLRGEGGYTSSVIVLVASSTTLLQFTTYNYITIEDIGFMTGTISIVGGVPSVTIPATSGDRTNTCMAFSTNSGGTSFFETRVAIRGFDRAYSTVTSTVNGDNNIHNQCSYFSNNYIWYNSNTQAVLWAFNNCKGYFNQTCFYDPGTNLIVFGGDWINPGSFLKSSGASSLCGNILVLAARFETYQNIDPTSTPKWIELASGSYQPIVFRDCSARGGGSLAGKDSTSLAGLFTVTFDGGYFDGNFAVSANSSASGHMSRLELLGMDAEPTVVQTVFPGQGNTPINLVRRDKYGAYRNMQGLLSSQTTPGGPGVAGAQFRFSATINVSSSGKDLNFIPAAPYSWSLGRSSISFKTGTTNNIVLTIWLDNGKTTKVWEKTKAGILAGQELTINPDDFTNQAVLTSASNPLYFEATSAANMGIVTANINLNFDQL